MDDHERKRKENQSESEKERKKERRKERKKERKKKEEGEEKHPPQTSVYGCPIKDNNYTTVDTQYYGVLAL